ncbi:MAG: hypothetical protein BEU04_02685 [Marine Group III euryarchaeote CG-Bathy1]|uniref:Glycerate kinase n=2 Tax=Methanobacteriati TaxID=3366610 RepID=A0A1J5TEN7_9ARCH|nr:putative glycerate kinase (GLYCTK) [uncultured marine group II/III euryarchaeote AD1000_61_A07]OIR14797.1 MAG: hypothetical protein BEU04_02685 [Marine Group III euryarchaeote CG-Bathy1]
MTDLRNDATSIFDSAVSSAMPSSLINKKIQRIGDSLIINNKKYILNRNVKVVAFGKASVDFSKSIENLIGDHITEGISSVPNGILNHFNYSNEKIILREGADGNLPDSNSEKTTKLICQMVKNSSKDDLILVLISGGGSSLLSMPAEGIPSSDKLQTIKLISQNGGDITQLNTVRKHISAVKGGQLSHLASPATILSLVISDVLGDSLDIIASGPTVQDSSTFGDALKVIHDLSLENKVPDSVMNRLIQGSLGELEETPKSCDNTDTFILGSNQDALDSAKKQAELLGYDVFVHSSNISGLARDVGLEYADLAKMKIQEGIQKRVCILGSGETTVVVKGKGLGGRSQELSLAAASELQGLNNVVLLSAGSDGQDGPTDAAGAFADGRTIERAKSLGLDFNSHLEDNDSYNFFVKLNDIFSPGLTGTNITDLQILLITP